MGPFDQILWKMVGNLPENPERKEQADNDATQGRKKEDPDPEFTRAHTSQVRIPRVHLGIEIIPHERASALRADGMEH
jgi:hypothetical protein